MFKLGGGGLAHGAAFNSTLSATITNNLEAVAYLGGGALGHALLAYIFYRIFYFSVAPLLGSIVG